MSTKSITVRFHLAHPAEKQAWEKLMSLRNERHQSFSQAVTDAVNAYETGSVRFSHEDEERLVQAITDSVGVRLQQILPSYLAGYAAGVVAPAAAQETSAKVTSPAQRPDPVQDVSMPDFDDSCMDFDFMGG